MNIELIVANKRKTNINANRRFEHIFVEILQLRFPKANIREATENENKYQHSDFFINNKGVDLKLPKKEYRGSNSFSLDIWVEFKNFYGYEGWLYGKQVAICLISSDLKCCYFISREELLNYCETKILGKEIVHNNPHAYYIPYNRPGNKDVIALFPLADIIKLPKTKLLTFTLEEYNIISNEIMGYLNNSI